MTRTCCGGSTSSKGGRSSTSKNRSPVYWKARYLAWTTSSGRPGVIDDGFDATVPTRTRAYYAKGLARQTQEAADVASGRNGARYGTARRATGF